MRCLQERMGTFCVWYQERTWLERERLEFRGVA